MQNKPQQGTQWHIPERNFLVGSISWLLQRDIASVLLLVLAEFLWVLIDGFLGEVFCFGTWK
jgi:hypothetical protein